MDDFNVISDMLIAYSSTVWIFSIAFTILLLVANWKMFEKAGEPGWASIVPFYNTYLLFKIAYGNGWKMLLLLIPIVNIVILIQYNFKLAKAFGQSTAFGFGLLFLSNIFTLIIAFDKNISYVGEQF